MQRKTSYVNHPVFRSGKKHPYLNHSMIRAFQKCLISHDPSIRSLKTAVGDIGIGSDPMCTREGVKACSVWEGAEP